MHQTSLFTRARLQLPLTPPERAFLKLLQGSVVTILLAAVVAALPFLEGQNINWTTVITVAAGAIVSTLTNTIMKYFSAQGDNPAATLVGDVGAVLQQKLGVNDVKQPA